ncbi:hypothetical protein D3C85_1889670 [compost metagenome]
MINPAGQEKAVRRFATIIRHCGDIDLAVMKGASAPLESANLHFPVFQSESGQDVVYLSLHI